MVLSDRNGTRLKALGDVRVRQALNYAVDRAAILKTVGHGIGTVTDQWFGPTTSAYDKSLENTYSYDPKKAKALLAEAGYPDGFTMSVTIPPIHEQLIQALQGYFAAVGVTLKIDDAQADYFADLEQAKDPAYTVTNAQQDMNSLAPSFLGADGLQNPFHTTDATVLSLLQSAKTASPADAKADYQKVNKLVTEQAWFVPIYNGDAIAFASDSVSVALWPGMSVPWIYSFAPKK
jgi:peptide/nickel transport system substrate-binding protein